MKERYIKAYNNLYTFEERKELVSEKIKKLRLESGLTQKEVSEIIDVTLPTYNSYETGRNSTPLEIIVRLSYLYQISTEEILQVSNIKKDKLKVKKKIEEYEKAIEKVKQKFMDSDLDPSIALEMAQKELDELKNQLTE